MNKKGKDEKVEKEKEKKRRDLLIFYFWPEGINAYVKVSHNV